MRLPPDAGRAERARVVVIDDYQPIRTLLRVAFEASGEADVVGEATDIDEALGVVARSTPDVVIVDLSVDQALPGLGAIRRLLPGCRIVAYSAQPASVVESSTLAAGADVYVEKGSARDLVAIAQAVVGAAPDVDGQSDALAAIAAHGLLNALTVVHGAASTLLSAYGKLPAEARETLHAMLCDQLSAVVGGLDAMPAAVTHRCLNELAAGFVACGPELAKLPRLRREEVLRLVADGAGRASAVLGDVARGLPEEIRAELDLLRH